MSTGFIVVVCVVVGLGLLALGCPIFICLGMAGVVGIFLEGGTEALFLLPTAVFGAVSKFTLVAVPLFLLMGEIIFRSGVASDIFDACSRLLHRVPGGLAMASVIACAVFGTMCGVSIAAVASIGVMALPEMLKRGYNPRLAAGAVCAPGALAMLMPTSVLFIIYGELARVSYTKFSVAGIIPVLLLTILMCGYIVIRVMISGQTADRKRETEPLTLQEVLQIIRRLWSPFLLIIVVLGSIYLGIATPTESAAIGVVGAYLIALFVYRSLNWQTFRATIVRAARVTSTILTILVGAVIFTQFLNLLRIPDSFAHFIAASNASPWLTMLLIQLMLFVLGMFIDGASMVIITTPILLPTVLALNWDPLWFGVLMIANIEMAVITPPVGLNLYTLGSISKDVNMETILKGTMPYVVVEIIGLLILIAFPQISLWLPNMMS